MRWQTQILSTICREDSPITYGILQPGPEVQDGVPYVRPSEIKDGRIDVSSVRRTSPAIADRYKKSIIREGDILITIVGTIGHIATVPPELDGGNITQSSARIRICSSKSDSDYVKHFLRSPYATRQYDRHRLGVAVSRLNLHHVRDLEIPLPPLAEQKRIAGILDAADALRAKRRDSLAQLDTLLQSTFLDMFGDPVTNPMGFPIKNLADFYVSKQDGTKCGPFGSALKKSELVDSGVPVWNMDNIESSGRARLPFRMWITKEKYQKLIAYSVLDGDVIISRAGTVGKMCVANSDYPASIISTNLIRVRLGPNLLPIHFVSLMNYCRGRVGRLKTGPDGAFTHMSTGILDKLKFPYPPLPLQHRFATVVDSVERQKTRQRAHLAELDNLFASLQSRAFRGEL